MPRRWLENQSLSIWVANQRAAKIKGKISKERVNRLTAIGFEWDLFSLAWEESFRALKQYKDKQGDCNVSRGFHANPSLANWVVIQRQLKIKGQLSKERTNQLTAIGFDWDPLTSAWEESFLALERYKAIRGDCNVPHGWPENPGLASWVANQRTAKIKGKISKERVNQLTAIGFEWDLLASAWEESFLALKQYQLKHGDCNVPRGWPENPGLGGWIHTQRRIKIKRQLSKERVNQLTAIGFDWDPFASVWEESFLALEQYKVVQGDCNIPQGWPKNPSLANWVATQRRLNIKGQLLPARVNQLTAIGFDWDPQASTWEESILALEQYKAKHGDCNVPGKCPENPDLGRWVSTQRKAKINGQLSKARVNQLTVIGFDWDPLESAWEENFLALEQYKAKQGDCNVPRRFPENPSLANWVGIQRQRKIKGQLSKERANRLIAIGFDWDLRASAWEESFRALEQYKVKHGNCNVPKRWPKNPGLGLWVSVQRRTKIKGRISKERVNRLTVIGFEWYRHRGG